MDNEQGAIAVPLSLFGGESLQLSPPDVPEGVSPGCFDVTFVPGSGSSRPGLHSVITNQTGSASIVYMKTYVQTDGNPVNLIFDSDGKFWSEAVSVSPNLRFQIFSYRGLNASPIFAQSVSAFGKEFIAINDGTHGLGTPLQYSGTNAATNTLDRVTQDGPAAAVSVVDSGVAGTISAGQHQCVVMFLTRNGAITAPSPASNWTAAGSKKAVISNIPIGPPNVVARILAFTGAGGGNFFYIPVQLSLPNPGSPPTIVAPTVINDNTSTSVTMDFSDNALFGATAIDIPGRNLFAQVVLAPVLGFFAYASRLCTYGEVNNVKNFLNMGFEGGALGASPNVPLAWTSTGPGRVGNLTNGGSWGAGQCYAFIGDGTANASTIYQPAYQDSTGLPIILPNTAYTFRCWVDGGNPGALLLVQLFSPATGFLANASVSIDPTGLGAITARYVQVNLGTMPAVIPSDLQLRVSQQFLNNNIVAVVDEFMMIYTQNPWNTNSRISYINNPEGFDGVTGVLGPANDQSGIQVAYEQQDVMYFHTLAGMYYTRDSGNSEPANWNVAEKSRKVGALCFRAADAGEMGVGTSAEDFAFIASRSGLYVFSGGEPLKISQEQQPRWDRINWSAVSSLWLKNDTSSRRVHIGLPLDQDTSPTLVLTMDYKELNTAAAVEGSGPIRISFSGKMIASDMTRKWSPWALPMTCGEILARPNNASQFCMGGSFANFYYLDPLKLTDDDYGAITPYYITYGFLNHEMEQQLGVGSHRKLFLYLTMYVSGVGQIRVTPLATNLTNAWNPLPTYPLKASPDRDLEWGVNVTAERCFFKIQSLPLPGQTDNSFNLQKMVISVKPDPWALVGGAI